MFILRAEDSFAARILSLSARAFFKWPLYPALGKSTSYRSCFVFERFLFTRLLLLVLLQDNIGRQHDMRNVERRQLIVKCTVCF